MTDRREYFEWDMAFFLKHHAVARLTRTLQVMIYTTLLVPAATSSIAWRWPPRKSPGCETHPCPGADVDRDAFLAHAGHLDLWPLRQGVGELTD